MGALIGEKKDGKIFMRVSGISRLSILGARFNLPNSTVFELIYIAIAILKYFSCFFAYCFYLFIILKMISVDVIIIVGNFRPLFHMELYSFFIY